MNDTMTPTLRKVNSVARKGLLELMMFAQIGGDRGRDAAHALHALADECAAGHKPDLSTLTAAFEQWLQGN